MSLSNAKDSFKRVVQLINSLLEGKIEISDFSLLINQESQQMSRNLFRDSIPKFSASIKEKFTDVFVRYFFNDMSIKANSLWKYVEDTKFWLKIKQFHDTVYSRNLAFSEIINYFDRNLASNHKGLQLNQLEKEILDELNNNPYTLYKTIASDLQISEKKVSTIISGLRDKGIYLGSSIDYKKIGFFEFFSFHINDKIREKAFLIEEISLFPQFKLYKGISKEKISDNSIHIVQEKDVIYNSRIINRGISICDWSQHKRFKSQNKQISENQENFNFSNTRASYIIELLRNCENNYKRPKINQISKNNDVSVRTLFRIKSKFKKNKVIQPKLFIECEDLMNVVVISDKTINEIYNKVPFVTAYQVENKNINMWLSFLSIFISDFKNLYSILRNKAEIFQIINKKLSNKTKEKLVSASPI